MKGVQVGPLRRNMLRMNRWKNLLDDYHDVYMTKSLVKKLINQCASLLENGHEDMQYDETNRIVTLYTPYGTVLMKNVEQVLIVEYSAEFEQKYSFTKERMDTLNNLLEEMVAHWTHEDE